MSFGNMPADGGKLLLTEKEATQLLNEEPAAKPYVLPLISAREFLNDRRRFCLWLMGIEPRALRQLKPVYDRVQAVREVRLKSSRPHLADVPNLFAQLTQDPQYPFVLIPRHSSENRAYIPIGTFEPGHVAHDSCMAVENGTEYHFGVLTSAMHMDWVRAVCGRLKSDYRYSKDIVYSNFPWPENISEKQEAEIERLAQDVLDARERYPDSTLADLFDPLTMPPELTKAHQALDRAVDRLYRRKPFESDKERLELLFKRYQELTEAQG